jgi:hypothetical protein
MPTARMTSNVTTTLVVVSAIWIGACAPPQAVPPKFAAGTDEATRQKLYDDNKLTLRSDWWSARWHRGSETYQTGQLDGVFDTYPTTRELKARVKRRATVIGTLAYTGGAIVGFTLGYNLVPSNKNEMSSGAQAALYSVGGGLIVASLLTWALWTDPSRELADTYNHSLRDDLGLSASSVRDKPPARAIAVTPAMVGDASHPGIGMGLAGQF